MSQDLLDFASRHPRALTRGPSVQNMGCHLTHVAEISVLTSSACFAPRRLGLGRLGSVAHHGQRWGLAQHGEALSEAAFFPTQLLAFQTEQMHLVPLIALLVAHHAQRSSATPGKPLDKSSFVVPTVATRGYVLSEGFRVAERTARNHAAGGVFRVGCGSES